MAKQFLSDDIIEHIQDGYYATHEQDLSEEQVHELSEEQLQYYNRQGKTFRAEQKKKHRLVVGGLIALAVVVIAVAGVLIFSMMNSDKNLYDPENPTESSTPGTSELLGTPPSNTKAGAKDNAAQ